MTFTKGHHSRKVVTILTLPNSAKTRDSVPPKPCTAVWRPEARARTALSLSREPCCAALHLTVLWCSCHVSHPHRSICFDSVIIWGNWTEWDELSEETGRSQPGFPAHLPTPTLAPGILQQTGPDQGQPGRQARAEVTTCQSPVSQLPRQGLGPSVHAGLQGTQFRQHTARRRAVRGFKLSQPH